MSMLPEEDLISAAELALGVLEDDALAQARLRRERDPAFAAAVEAWEARLAPLTAETASVEPPERVWSRIEAAAFGAPPPPAAANDDARLRFWRRWAVGASGVAAASLAALFVLASRPEPVAPPAPELRPVRVASVAANGGVAVTVGVDPNDGALMVKAGEGLRGDRRVPYLWLLFPDGTAQWVAVVPVDGEGRLVLPADVASRVSQANAVAISMEPEGVVPERNKPGGPVIGAGDLSDL